MSSKTRKYKECVVARGSAFYTLLEELDAERNPKQRKELQARVDTEYKRLDDAFHKHFPRELWTRLVNELKIR